MFSERYVPKRYELSRKYRRRHRIKIAALVVVAVALLVLGLWLILRHTSVSIFGGGGATAVPAATVTATPTRTPAVTASPTAAPSTKPTATVRATATATIKKAAASLPPGTILNPAGVTVAERFLPPAGYRRTDASAGTFAAYLRGLRLKPAGTKAKYFDGRTKDDKDYIAVVDMNIGKIDLQQSADTMMRLNAQYRLAQGQHSKIAYHFASGFLFEWDKWRQGNRVQASGSKFTWVKSGTVDSSNAALQAYLNTLYNYAAYRSLEEYDLKDVNPRDMQIGDLFIEGTSHGDAVMIADMAVNSAGKKCFLLLQGGYKTAQDVQILCNPQDGKNSPWVFLPDQPKGTLKTPEFDFTWDQLMRFKD